MNTMDTKQYRHFLSLCTRNHTDEAARFAFSDWLLENGEDRLSALVAKYPIIQLDNIQFPDDTLEGIQSYTYYPAPRLGTIVLVANIEDCISGPYYIVSANVVISWDSRPHFIHVKLLHYYENPLC